MLSYLFCQGKFACYLPKKRKFISLTISIFFDSYKRLSQTIVQSKKGGDKILQKKHKRNTKIKFLKGGY